MTLNGQHGPSDYYERHQFDPGADYDERFPPPPETETAPRKLPPLRWHRDSDPNADRSWLVKDLVPEAGKGLLSGQWGSGKTFGVLDLCASAMTGHSFAGRRVLRRGGILFIAPEGAFEIPIRLRGLVTGKIAGETWADAAAGEVRVDPEDLPFAWIEECPRLVDAGALEDLAAVADQAAVELRTRYDLPLVLIVVDTIAAGAGFDDENSAAETQKVMNALEGLSQRTGAFVFGVDHFGKTTETGTRGSSAKEAAADVVLAMLANRDEAGNVSNMRMAVRKLRGGRIGQETPYTLDQVEIGQDRWGDPITTCVVNWQSNRTSDAAVEAVKERWPTSLKVFREAMVAALDGSGIRAWPHGAEGYEVRAAPLGKIRDEFKAIYPADGDSPRQREDAKRSAFKRAMDSARTKKLIGSRDLNGVDHLWLVQDGETP